PLLHGVLVVRAAIRLEPHDRRLARVDAALELVDARVQRREARPVDAVQVEQRAGGDEALAHLALGRFALVRRRLLRRLLLADGLAVRRLRLGQLFAARGQLAAVLGDRLGQRVDGTVELGDLGGGVIARGRERGGFALGGLRLGARVGRGVGPAALLRRRDVGLGRLRVGGGGALLGRADL